MLKKRKKKVSEGIPTSSTADIAFLLLVFFLVTTSFSNHKGLFITLPEKSDNQEDTSKKLNPKNVTEILVNAQGQISVKYVEDMQAVTLDELYKKIISQIELRPDKMIISVKVDRDAQYERMVDVMDEVNRAKAPRVNIVTN